MSNVIFILEPRMPNNDAYTAIKSIIAQQREALLIAISNVRGNPVKEVIKEYRATLVPLIHELHSLGYPIVRFYIDHSLITFVNEHRYHISVLHTLYKYLHRSRGLLNSCSIRQLQHQVETLRPCGTVHIHNNYNPTSPSTIRIHLPHMFYTQLHFLEVILVGGLPALACRYFQSFYFWHKTVYSFYKPK